MIEGAFNFKPAIQDGKSGTPAMSDGKRYFINSMNKIIESTMPSASGE